MKAETSHEVLEVAPVLPRHEEMRRARPRTGGIHRRRASKTWGASRRRHGDDRQPPRRPALPATRRRSKWCSAGCNPIDRATDSKNSRRAPEDGLNDASFSFLPETSYALGFGFRCGFLGMLHMEIISSGLEKEGGDSI